MSSRLFFTTRFLLCFISLPVNAEVTTLDATGRQARPTTSCHYSVLFYHDVCDGHMINRHWYNQECLSGYCAAQLISKQQCSTAEAQRVGRLTVLPILLSAVLPYANFEGRALEEFLQRLAADGAHGDPSCMWVVQHIQVQPQSHSRTCQHPATGLA